MNRLIKRKNLFALLFAVLLALPMCAILGRVLYTQWNKNAKDSYSDTYIEKYSVVNQASMLVEYNKYQVLYNGVYGNYSAYINVYDTDFGNYINLEPTLSITTIYFVNEANYARINLTLSNGESMRIDNWNNYTTSFYITYKASNINTSNTFPRASLYLITYDLNTLDNAFEYSVNQFINDNNFGKLDFFQWFDNMFLDPNNSVNNMYVHFVNWYLNYALLISLAYILFLVLMWFINYVRKLLEKGMDFGEGSY